MLFSVSINTSTSLSHDWSRSLSEANLQDYEQADIYGSRSVVSDQREINLKTDRNELKQGEIGGGFRERKNENFNNEENLSLLPSRVLPKVLQPVQSISENQLEFSSDEHNDYDDDSNSRTRTTRGQSKQKTPQAAIEAADEEESQQHIDERAQTTKSARGKHNKWGAKREGKYMLIQQRVGQGQVIFSKCIQMPPKLAFSVCFFLSPFNPLEE